MQDKDRSSRILDLGSLRILASASQRAHQPGLVTVRFLFTEGNRVLQFCISSRRPAVANIVVLFEQQSCRLLQRVWLLV